MAMSFGVELFVMTVLLVSSGERCNGAVVETFSLAKGWTVKNENGSKLFTDVTLPNGVYTLYKRQYPSEDILDSYNDVQLRWIGMEDWTWTTEFDTPDSHQSRKFVNLTFFGIDTVATIKLNGELLGKTNNMFNRYSFNTKDKLSVAGKNQLEVRIKSPIREAKRLAALYPGIPPECPDRKYNGECHMNMLRKMQSSFSWDWGLAAPSLGIWKTVLLEVHDVAIIRDVDVATTVRDDKWVINVKVYLETGLQEPFYGDLTMYAVDIFDDPVKIVFDKDPVDYRNPVITFSESVDKNRIKRWWPNGYGDPKLYHIHFTWHGCFASGHDPKLWSISQKSIRIGFRTIELIQRELADGNTFLFKVNNVEMFMKGSNWIPSHILPERNADENRVKYLLKAAKDANLNMLRVWGGGVYESDYFYDLADSYGILIWQDMMFACAMYPVFDDFLKSVETETIQNALRIAYHPSIAIWATNNENEVALAQNWYNTSHTYDLFAENYRELYVATVYHALKPIVHSGRPEVLYSSPSNGLKTEESNFLSKDPQNHHYGDVHYYNYDFDGWNPVIYPKARFISEYGFQSFPSITSWYQVMAKNDNLSDLMDHRQHSPLTSAPIMGQLERHFFVPDKSDSNYLAAVIYLSQVSQAMIVKTETELYRSLRSTEYNTMGALYWQLNDVWIAPSWSSIDFHGRFKILQYWAKEFMAPLAVIAQADTYNNVNVYVAYDTKEEDDRTLIVTMNTIMWSSLLPKNSTIWPFVIRNNTVAKIQTFSYEDYLHGPFNVRNSFLQFVLHDVSGNVYSTTYLFPANFRTVENVNDGDPTAIITNQRCDSSMFDNKLTKMVSLSIKVRYPSLFVFLEFIRTDIKKHSFSKNGFIQVEPIQTVYLEYEDENCLSRDFRLTDITISHANIYLKK